MNIFFRIGLCSFLCWAMIACNNNKPADTLSNKVVADTAKFYPIDRFIADEIKYVDLRNFSIVEKKSNSKDSSSRVISKEDFLAASAAVLKQAQWFLLHLILMPMEEAIHFLPLFSFLHQ